MVSVRVLEPELVTSPLKVNALPPVRVVLPPSTTLFDTVRDPPPACSVAVAFTLNVPVPSAVLLPTTSVVFAVSIEAVAKLLSPFNCIVPPPRRLRFTPAALVIALFTISVPPTAWTNEDCVPVFGARFKATAIVLVPDVFSARIAAAVEFDVPLAPLVLTPVRVKIAPPVLVRLYPDVAVPEKYTPALDKDALTFGCVTGAAVNWPTSPAPGGTPPVQLGPAL
jgi:hypothetical protein